MSIRKSTRVKRLYPLILFFEIVSVSAVLTQKSMLDVSLYVSLSILIFTALFKFIMSPYHHALDNARLFIHQFLLILINCLQIIFKVLKNQPKSEYNTVYHFPWAILVILTIIIVGNTIPYLTYKIIIWFRGRGLIDI